MYFKSIAYLYSLFLSIARIQKLPTCTGFYMQQVTLKLQDTYRVIIFRFKNQSKTSRLFHTSKAACKRAQQLPTILRQPVSNFAQQHATGCANGRKTCNIQQCCVPVHWDWYVNRWLFSSVLWCEKSSDKVASFNRAQQLTVNDFNDILRQFRKKKLTSVRHIHLKAIMC